MPSRVGGLGEGRDSEIKVKGGGGGGGGGAVMTEFGKELRALTGTENTLFCPLGSNLTSTSKRYQF